MDVELEDAERPLSDNELKSVTALARQQYDLEKKIKELETELEEKRKELKGLKEAELPNMMNELGLQGFTLSNGWAIRIDPQIYASISKENQDEAYTWLESNGHGDLIKREFNIKFNKEQEKDVKKFQRDLSKRKKPLNVSIKKSVHHQTLNSWVRESIAGGIVIPEKTFGVYRQKVAVLVPPKKELGV